MFWKKIFKNKTMFFIIRRSDKFFFQMCKVSVTDIRQVVLWQNIWFTGQIPGFDSRWAQFGACRCTSS